MKKIVYLLLAINTGLFAQVPIPKSTTTFSNISATGNVTAKSLSSNGTFNYNRNYLKDWDAQINKIQQTTASSTACVVAIGDSWTMNSCYAQPVAAYLRSNYGDAGCGFYGASSVNIGSTYGSGIYNVTRTKVGSWADIGGNNTYVMSVTGAADSTSTVGDSIYYIGRATDFNIHYMKKSSGGAFVVRVDGTNPTTVTTSGTTSWSVTSKTGLSDATHTLSIKCSSAGSGIIISGCEINRNQNGVRFHNLGSSGWKSSDFANINATQFQNSITQLNPNLVIICLGTNDCTQSVTPTSYVSNITTIVNNVLAAKPNCGILLFTGADIGNTTTYSISQYVSALKAYALNNNYGFIDNYSLIGDYTTANSRGLYSSTNHINNTGGGILQQNLINYLLPLTNYNNLNSTSINLGMVSASTNTTNFGSVRMAQRSAFMDFGELQSGIFGFWANQTNPNLSNNYTLMGDASNTYLMAPSIVNFRIANTAKMLLTSTGLRIGSTVPVYPLDITGNMGISGHIINTNTTIPTATVGSGAGTGATYTLSANSTDLSGLISITTGTASMGAGATLITLTFNSAYSVAPNIVLTPANSAAAVLTGNSQVYVDGASTGTTTFLLKTGASVLTTSTVFKWYYTVFQ